MDWVMVMQRALPIPDLPVSWSYMVSAVYLTRKFVEGMKCMSSVLVPMQCTHDPW
jgi:hypothetical protein